MKFLLRILTLTMLSACGVGCRDSSGASGAGSGPGSAHRYRISQPAPEEVTDSATALLDSCDAAGIPLRDALVSTPREVAIETLLQRPVHPSVHSWFVWMDGLGLPEKVRRPLEFPPGAAFLSRAGVRDLAKQTSTELLGAPGFEGSQLVPVSGLVATVSVECDAESPLYGAVVASSERGWNGAQFYPSLVSYLNFLRACVQEEAIIWDGDRDMLVVDFQKVRVIEAELGVTSAFPAGEDE
ncbi:hypothetical protein [Verrucomicrobium sp. BvORR034]|uniref:hypothetical protein n=1 Tax=Verrucomicrobium sp. BvORR034 TaxID=1396418 RepID=UPI0006793261|nr:hypothetical protein [Verrucomicrobium sp. BvORR034]